MYLNKIEIVKNEPIVVWDYNDKINFNLTTVDLIYHTDWKDKYKKTIRAYPLEKSYYSFYIFCNELGEPFEDDDCRQICNILKISHLNRGKNE